MTTLSFVYFDKNVNNKNKNKKNDGTQHITWFGDCMN
jgi:hypothetical protein